MVTPRWTIPELVVAELMEIKEGRPATVPEQADLQLSE